MDFVSDKEIPWLAIHLEVTITNDLNLLLKMLGLSTSPEEEKKNYKTIKL